MTGRTGSVEGTEAPAVEPIRGLPSRDGRTAAGARTRVLSADALAGLALFALCVILVALTWRTWGDLSRDTGYDLLAATKLDHGSLPYVDYFYYYGPLGPFVLGALMKITGVGLAPAVGLGLVVALGIVFGTYTLARLLVGVPAALVAAALAATAAFASGNNSFVMPNTATATFAVALSLGALIAIGVFARGGSRWLLAAAGTMLGLLALTRPEYVLGAFLAAAVWIVMRRIDAAADAAPKSAWRRELALLAIPAVAIPAIVYGLFLTRISVHTLLYENLYPVDTLRAAGNHVLKAHAPLTPGSFAKLAGHLVLYAAGAAALVAAGVALARSGRLGRAMSVLAVGAVVVFLAVLAVKPETIRYYLEFAYAWIPAGAWLTAGVLLYRFRRRAGRWPADEQLLMALTLVLAVVSTKSYAQFYPFPNADHPQDTAYAMPLVAVILVWLHGHALPRLASTRARRRASLVGVGWVACLVVASAGLALHDSNQRTSIVRGPHGTTAALPSDGPAYQAALQAIERNTRPGDPILLAPQMSALYVMSGRSEPLQQLELLPGTLPTPAAEERAIAKMGDVRLAITDRAALTNYGQGAFGKSFDRRLAAWLAAHFNRIATLRGLGGQPRVLDVWMRRGVSPP